MVKTWNWNIPSYPYYSFFHLISKHFFNNQNNKVKKKNVTKQDYLISNSSQVPTTPKSQTSTTCREKGGKQKQIKEREKKGRKSPHLCTDSLNFSSSRNWSMRNTNSLLREVISDTQIQNRTVNFDLQTLIFEHDQYNLKRKQKHYGTQIPPTTDKLSLFNQLQLQILTHATSKSSKKLEPHRIII